MISRLFVRIQVNGAVAPVASCHRRSRWKAQCPGTRLRTGFPGSPSTHADSQIVSPRLHHPPPLRQMLRIVIRRTDLVRLLMRKLPLVRVRMPALFVEQSRCRAPKPVSGHLRVRRSGANHSALPPHAGPFFWAQPIWLGRKPGSASQFTRERCDRV